MKVPKCPKTVSGKHLWKDYFDGYGEIVYGEGTGLPVSGVPKLIKKCEACGMIDDRKKSGK